MKKGKNVFTIRVLRGTVAAAAAAGLMGALTGCSAGVEVPDTIKVENVGAAANQIKVTGRDTVKIVPDMANIIFSVRTQGETAEQCQQENAKNLDATIQKLKELGIAEESMQTSSYDLSPTYDWNSPVQAITGYEMNTQLTVSDIPISQSGEIISQAVVSGVNSIERIGYFCSSYDESYQQALKKAVAMAYAKATALAEAGNQTLGAVIGMEEYGYQPDVRYTGMGVTSGADKYAAESTAAAMDMGVMAGQMDIEASVEVTYGIQQ